MILKLRVLADTSGQGLIEYALMVGFVAVAAGAVMPGVASSISTIFSKVGSVLKVASHPRQLGGCAVLSLPRPSDTVLGS